MGQHGGLFRGRHAVVDSGREKPIEQFKPGDWVLSAPEGDPAASPEPRQVEEVFVNLMPLLELRVGGKTICTTAEHPFYVHGKGWTAGKDLQTGDLLRSHDGQWKTVESVTEGEGLAPVYNLRVAEHHTYFVGSREWGFSVWAHNACNMPAFAEDLGTKGFHVHVNGVELRVLPTGLGDFTLGKVFSSTKDSAFAAAARAFRTWAGSNQKVLLNAVEKAFSFLHTNRLTVLGASQKEIELHRLWWDLLKHYGILP